ncbi:unnamed protein product [Brassica oleracea]
MEGKISICMKLVVKFRTRKLDSKILARGAFHKSRIYRKCAMGR